MSLSQTSVALLAGPQLLGFFFDWALQGVLSVQIYIYYLLFPQDPLATKILVYGTCVYEWIQTVLVTQAAFEVDVYHFGDGTSLTAFHNTWFSVTIMCAIISAVVQEYFCWRIYVLSRSRLLAGAIMLFAFCQMCVGLAGGAMLHIIHATAAQSSAVAPIISSWLIGAAFVDVIIAACMTYFLVRSKTGIRQSDAVVNRLARLVIESGILTATVAIVIAICFTTIPQTLLYECPALVLAKLYANTLLVSLNNRAVMRRMDHVHDSSGTAARVGFPTTISRSATVGPAGNARQSGHMRVEVSREEYILRDVLHDIALRDTGGECKGESEVLDITRKDTLASGKREPLCV